MCLQDLHSRLSSDSWLLKHSKQKTSTEPNQFLFKKPTQFWLLRTFNSTTKALHTCSCGQRMWSSYMPQRSGLVGFSKRNTLSIVTWKTLGMVCKISNKWPSRLNSILGSKTEWKLKTSHLPRPKHWKKLRPNLMLKTRLQSLKMRTTRTWRTKRRHAEEQLELRNASIPWQLTVRKLETLVTSPLPNQWFSIGTCLAWFQKVMISKRNLLITASSRRVWKLVQEKLRSKTTL